MRIAKLQAGLLACVVLVASCSNEEGDAGRDPRPEPVSAAVAEALVLASDPGAALGVVAAKQAGAAEAVVVEGRVQHVVPGYAILKLTDTSMPYCGETNPEDKCKTPWDYCCESKEDRAASTLLVEFRGEDGAPLAVDALPRTRHCDLLKVSGELMVDEHGNPVLVASGLFQVERPELPAYVRWPSGQ